MTDTSNSVVKSVGRVFEVFELFDRLREPATATRIGRSLDYPQSSTVALLKSMVSLGYLAYDPLEKTYCPTLRIAFLSHWIETSLCHEGDLHGMIAEIAEHTGETVSISVQNDLLMQFIHIHLGSQPLTLSLKPGEVAPLFRSGVGWAVLAAKTDEEIARLLERFNRLARAKAERLDGAEVRDKIAETRGRGYAVAHGAYIPGAAAIAWTLPEPQTRRPLVLSVGGPTERLLAEEADIVAVVGRALERFMSARPTHPDAGVTRLVPPDPALKTRRRA